MRTRAGEMTQLVECEQASVTAQVRALSKGGCCRPPHASHPALGRQKQESAGIPSLLVSSRPVRKPVFSLHMGTCVHTHQQYTPTGTYTHTLTQEEGKDRQKDRQMEKWEGGKEKETRKEGEGKGKEIEEKREEGKKEGQKDKSMHSYLKNLDESPHAETI